MDQQTGPHSRRRCTDEGRGLRQCDGAGDRDRMQLAGPGPILRVRNRDRTSRPTTTRTTATGYSDAPANVEIGGTDP